MIQSKLSELGHFRRFHVTENVKESLEPDEVDKSGSEASDEGTHGLSKMFALLGYCTEFLNPGTTRICPEKKSF